MALLVTLFLVLVNIFNSVTANSPKAEGSCYPHLIWDTTKIYFPVRPQSELTLRIALYFPPLLSEMMISCWKVSQRWRPGWCPVLSTSSVCWLSTLSYWSWSRVWRGERRRRRKRSSGSWGDRLSRREGELWRERERCFYICDWSVVDSRGQSWSVVVWSCLFVVYVQPWQGHSQTAAQW